MLLARVDGKSPVEYLVTDAQRTLVRRIGKHFLLEPPAQLETLRTAWANAIHT